MIRIAEKVNKLEHFFEQLSDPYTEEVEYKTNAISGLLEPLIIIFLGLVVEVILIAMYLPMFQVSNIFLDENIPAFGKILLLKSNSSLTTVGIRDDLTSLLLKILRL